MHNAPEQQQLTLRFRRPVMDKIRRIAIESEVSYAEVVRRAVEQALAQYEPTITSPLPVILTEASR